MDSCAEFVTPTKASSDVLSQLRAFEEQAERINLDSIGMRVPWREFAPGEQKIAILEDLHLRRMFALMEIQAIELGHMRENLAAQAIHAGRNADEWDKSGHKDFMRQLILHQLFEKLFWAKVRLAIPEAITKKTIAIRIGWIVVCCNEADHTAPTETDNATASEKRTIN